LFLENLIALYKADVNMSKSFFNAFGALVVILLGLGSCVASNWISHPFGNGNIAWWESLGQPPDGAASFSWAVPNWSEHRLQLYVKTTTGKTYSCCGSKKQGWEEASLKEELKESICKWYRDRLTQLIFSNIDVSQVKDCTLMPWSMEWFADEDMYVILESGSVWKWHHYWGLPQMIGFGCGIPLLVEILGWITFILLNRRKKEA
jgi:hypothetical protein